MHREGIAPEGAPADDDVAAQVAAWLAQDIPGEIARMILAAEFPARRGLNGTTSGEIGVPSDNPDWDGPIAQSVGATTPDQLRAIAAKHDQAADDLLEDADQLREYADALEDRTPLGEALHEHFRVMLDEAEHQSQAFNDRWAVYTGEDGVGTWRAVGNGIQNALWRADLLTVDAVRDALHTGELWDVDGIGPARYRSIESALRAGEVS